MYSRHLFLYGGLLLELLPFRVRWTDFSALQCKVKVPCFIRYARPPKRLRNIFAEEKPETNREIENHIGYPIRKTVCIFAENRKPNVEIRKNRKPQQTPKPKNRSFSVQKPKNRSKKWPKPQNRKSQRHPLKWFQTLCE